MANTSKQHVKSALSPSDEAMLRALWRYHYLTSRQICRLTYSSGSITYVQSKLKDLTEAGYCQRLWLPKREPHGSSPAVYGLARRGINYLKMAGLTVDGRYRPSEEGDLSFLFLTHTLELNDFLISAELFCRAMPDFKIAALLHERDLKRHPVYVRNARGQRAAVVPDAWLDIRIQGRFQVCLVVELDRGTEEQQRWRQKVANLIAYANGPYQETFETRSITIAVLTTAGEKRLLNLLEWTQAEMQAKKEQSQADLFLFTSANPEIVDSESMFLSPRWYRPFGPEPVALLSATDWI